ncbi:DUF6461 domain-containing protein [Streptomyces iconiensis]|uniref:DUF6461 domain-containing protein n=1 Tax=Streptomyces iconiensis TaxID=1384038 RepID=A0ABT7A9G9_9ACTN|nr:DUF6461 domain-containing protein [Streptomyces iconiensis]MDJ1137456.1 DUF6461 domain-containing protein [Streptomyces iconiensis]
MDGSDVDEDAVVRIFGGDPGAARPMGLEELGAYYAEELVLVSRSRSAVVVVENNGYQGSREEVLRPLSRLGRTVSAFWNVNAVSRLNLAEDGLIASEFDMIAPEEEPYGSRPDAWEPLLKGLVFESGARWGAGLAAIERATSARFDDAWLDGPHRAVEITPVPEYLLKQHAYGDSPLLEREPFVSYLADLGPAVLERIRRHALDLALTHADLREHPLAVAALAAHELPATTRARLRDDLTAAADKARARFETLRGEELDDFGPVHERPSHPAFRQAAVFRALARCVVAQLPTTRDHLPDIVSSLATAMTGEGERVAEFWLLDRLHDLAQRET